MSLHERDYLTLKPQPRASQNEAERYEPPSRDAFATDRDVVLPKSEDVLPAREAALRELVEAELKAHYDVVAMRIAQLDNHEGENDAQLEGLTDQLRLIEADLATVRTAPAMLIVAMAAALPAQAAAVQRVANAMTVEGTLQAGVLMAEVTVASIDKMSIGEMASGFTAAHFSQMSDAQLDAVGRKVDAHVDASLASHPQVRRELEEIAQQNGTAGNLDAYDQQRRALDEREADARARDDREELARVAYLRSLNAATAAREIDADPDYVAERDAQVVADRAAYVAKVRETATRKARAAGKTPEETQRFIEEAEQGALTSLETEAAAITARKVVSEPKHQAQAAATNVNDERAIAEKVSEATSPEQQAQAATEFTPDISGFGAFQGVPLEIRTAADRFKAEGAPATAVTPTNEQPEQGEAVAPTQLAVAPSAKGSDGKEV